MQGERNFKLKGGRPLRRLEESQPGPDYVERIEALGPRPRESILSFVMRIAALRAGRTLILTYAERFQGNKSRIAKKLGIEPHSLNPRLENLGISLEEISQFKPSDNEVKK